MTKFVKGLNKNLNSESFYDFSDDTFSFLARDNCDTCIRENGTQFQSCSLSPGSCWFVVFLASFSPFSVSQTSSTVSLEFGVELLCKENPGNEQTENKCFPGLPLFSRAKRTSDQ